MYFKRTTQYWLPILIILAMVGATFLNLRLSDQFKHIDEFAPHWMAAKAWMRDGTSPYSEDTHEETLELLSQYGYAEDELNQGYFLEPVFNLYLYIPLSLVDYPIARAIWMTLIELACILSCWISLKLAGLKLHPVETLVLLILSVISYPIFKSILSASSMPIFVFLVLLACYLAKQDKGTAAGILLFLSLGTIPISFMVAIFLIVWKGSKRDQSIMPLYLIGVAFLIVTSLILFPGWIPEWFASFISIHPDIAWVDTPLMRIAEFFPGATTQISIALHVVVLFVLLVEWYGIIGKDGRQIQWKILITLNLLYFINPTSAGSYMIWAWPALFLFGKFLTEKWRITGKIIFWIILFALVYAHWTSFSDAQNWFQRESSLVVLLFPTVTMIGLEWTRWWAIDSPKPLLD
ncbi:MAG: glycosyltransferase family 87 protein [Anaerolineaceae bacterium]